MPRRRYSDCKCQNGGDIPTASAKMHGRMAVWCSRSSRLDRGGLSTIPAMLHRPSARRSHGQLGPWTLLNHLLARYLAILLVLKPQDRVGPRDRFLSARIRGITIKQLLQTHSRHGPG